MEIKTSGLNTNVQNTQSASSKQITDSDIKFADELQDLKMQEDGETPNTQEKSTDLLKENTETVADTKEEKVQETENKTEVDNAIDNLTIVVSKLNQPYDNTSLLTKDKEKNTDKNKEGVDMINNDFGIDNKDKLPQMMPNMNFGGDGQPFSSFMNNDSSNSHDGKEKLASSAKDLAEEAAILSTMAENIAIANQNTEVKNEKTILNEEGIKKIDTKSNIVTEIVVKYDTIVMDADDVAVFTDLVEGKDVNINNLSADTVRKSVHVSKTLADMLAKAMNDNKPLRIEFDNGISVIIKISRDGKLSADFLPSTQVAEAYLKENLPLLKQRLSEQNLDYDELNQRERRNSDREQNKKKGNKNE